MSVSEEIHIEIEDALYWRIIQFSSQHDTTIGGVIAMTLEDLERRATGTPAAKPAPAPPAAAAAADPAELAPERPKRGGRRMANPLLRRCACCPGGCQRVLEYRGTYRCGCPNLKAA